MTPTTTAPDPAQVTQALAAFKSRQNGSVPAAPAVPSTTATPSATPTNPVAKGLDQYRARRDSGNGAASTTPAIPKDNPNALVALAKGVFSAIDPVDSFVASQVPKVPGEITDAFKGGVAQAKQGYENAKNAKNPLDLIAGSTKLAAGTANTLFSPLAPVFAPVGEAVNQVANKISDLPAVQDFATSKPGEATSKVADFTNDLSTVVGAVAGGKEGAPIAEKAGPAVVQHFVDLNKQDIARPTVVNEPKYAKATAVFNDAKARGINLDQVASDRGIIHDKIAEGGKYNTKDTANLLRQENYTDGNTIIRPALQSIEPSVQKVPIDQIRGALLKQIHEMPATTINDAGRAALERRVNSTYSEGSAADKAHPNGYGLTDLYDSRIEAGKRGKYVAGITAAPEVLNAKMARAEEAVFKNTFDRSIPKDSGLDGIRKEFEKNFLLADYLDKLHGKTIPEGITKKAIRLFGRAAGGSLGGKVGGFPGFLFGSNIGDALFRSFEVLPNPVKMAVLSKLQVTKDPAFATLNKYLGDKETARLLQKALPAPGQSSFREPQAPIFTTPKGKSTPIKSEAVDVASVESGKAKTPQTNRRLKSYLDKIDRAQLNPIYTPDNKLPVIDAGTKPKTKKSLNDIQF